MGTGPEDLQALCQEFLDACVEALDTIPVFAPGLGGAPERSYISPGQSADDCCPQLTVWSGGIQPSPRSPGNFTGKSAGQGQIIAVPLTARIIRCVETKGDPPPMDALQDAAEQINADGFALWNHVFNLVRAGQLFTVCGEVFWQGLRSIVPSGGCGGYTLSLLVEIDGYQETL